MSIFCLSGPCSDPCTPPDPCLPDCGGPTFGLPNYGIGPDGCLGSYPPFDRPPGYDWQPGGFHGGGGGGSGGSGGGGGDWKSPCSWDWKPECPPPPPCPPPTHAPEPTGFQISVMLILMVGVAVAYNLVKRIIPPM